MGQQPGSPQLILSQLGKLSNRNQISLLKCLRKLNWKFSSRVWETILIESKTLCKNLKAEGNLSHCANSSGREEENNIGHCFPHSGSSTSSDSSTFSLFREGKEFNLSILPAVFLSGALLRKRSSIFHSLAEMKKLSVALWHFFSLSIIRNATVCVYMH